MALPTVSDAQLAAMQAEASFRSGAGGGSRVQGPAMMPIAKLLPASVRTILGGRVLNPKIHEADLRRAPDAPQPIVDDWLRAVRRLAEGRGKGDPLGGIIINVASCIAGSKRGRVSFASIAELGCVCMESVRRAVRWLEDVDLLDTFNVLERAGKLLLRGVNFYLRRVPDAPAAASEAPAAAGPPDAEPAVRSRDQRRATRFEDRLRRWAPHLGLVMRPWGLNATPVGHPRAPPD